MEKIVPTSVEVRLLARGTLTIGSPHCLEYPIKKWICFFCTTECMNANGRLPLLKMLSQKEALLTLGFLILFLVDALRREYLPACQDR